MMERPIPHIQTKTLYNNDNTGFKETLLFLKESVDLNLLLVTLGFKVSKETHFELRASCIIHGGDNQTSFRLNKKTRTWSCFSHSCDSLYGKDIIALVRACRGCTFMEAVTFLKELTGFGEDFSYEKSLEYKRAKNKKDFIEEHTQDKELKKVKSKYLDESILECNKFLRSNYFIVEDSFDVDTLDFFGISGGYVDENGHKRDVIPIRDINNTIVGCAFSDTKRSATYKDKYLFTPNLDKDNIFYNLNNAVKYIEDKPLIIVEGFKSVWRLYKYGIKNVVACMGTSITEGQKQLLMLHAPKGAILMFDNDPPGVKGMIRSIEFIGGKVNVEAVFITEFDKNGKGLDPADLSKEQIYSYLSDYIA